MKNSGYYREKCNKMAQGYDRFVSMVLAFFGGERKFREKILEFAQIRKGERILDVCCGTGTLAKIISESYQKHGAYERT
ncbi:MAG: class I SAM-dependent methyltransferase [Candidatus Methanofastidiosia archaeon]